MKKYDDDDDDDDDEWCILYVAENLTFGMMED
jgi:hypothetical protein